MFHVHLYCWGVSLDSDEDTNFGWMTIPAEHWLTFVKLLMCCLCWLCWCSALQESLICFGTAALDLAQLHVFFHVPELISRLGTCASGKCCALTGSLVLTELINSSLFLAVLTWTGSWRSVWSFYPQVLLVRELTIQQVWNLQSAASNVMSFVELNTRCERRGGHSVWNQLGPTCVVLLIPSEPLLALCSTSELVLQCLFVYAILDQS